MKKLFMLIIVLLSFMSFANMVKAVNIEGVSIMGSNHENIGEDFYLTFSVNFSDLETGWDKNLGIWYAGFELIYDDSFFTIENVKSQEFFVNAYTQDGKYYIMGEVIENLNSSNHCAGGLLYCGSFIVNVKFSINETEMTSSTIKIGEIEVGLLDMNGTKQEYSQDDIIWINGISAETHTVSTVEIPSNNSYNNNLNNKDQTISTTITSSNAYLKSLEIENYNINFDKNQDMYKIEVDSNVNTLNINVLVEDNKATYNIKGADDLKNNNYKVTIEVTAEDGIKKYYSIYVDVKEEEKIIEKNKIKQEIKKEENIQEKVNEKVFPIIIITITIILVITIISIIIWIKNKIKLDRMLDEL